MLKFLVVSVLAMFGASAFAEPYIVGAEAGTVKRVDRAGKLVVVETADGTEHTFHYAGDLTVHTGKDAKKPGDDSLRGVDKGSQVAVHYTADGGREPAHEIDRLGDGGMKVIKGIVKDVDRAARKISIATAGGTLETVGGCGRGIGDAGADIGKETEKAAKVSVYYTGDAGKKTAHFIERL